MRLLVVLSVFACTTGPDLSTKDRDDFSWSDRVRLHRLTSSQLHNAAAELMDQAPSAVPVREAVPHGYTDDRIRGPDPYLVEELVRWIAEVARPIATGASGRARCNPSETACSHEIVTTLLQRAWRRPLTEQDRAWATQTYDELRVTHSNYEALVHTTVAILSSPEFLYLVEHGGPKHVAGRAPLTSHEIGNRLTFLLWDGPPDEVALRLIENGLHDAEDVRSLADQLLDNGKSRRGFLRFFSEWLDVDGGLNQSLWDLQTFVGLLDPALAEQYQAALAEDDQASIVNLEVTWRAKQREFKEGLVAEITQLADQVLSFDGTYGDLLTMPDAWVSMGTAPIYGLRPNDFSTSGRWTTLDPEVWPGILTRGGVLAARAHGTEPSPVLRGAFIADRILCTPPPSPPAGIPSLEAASATAEWTTNRERYEAASSPPACSQCHDAFNPYGYVFEGFHAIGAPRELVDGSTADTQATLPGLGDVDGPAGMMQALASSRQAHDCFVSQFFEFATYGTATSATDRAEMQRLQEEFWASGGNIRELVLGLATSEVFLSIPVEVSP